MHEALTLAQDLSHPYSLAHALSFAAMLHQFCGQRQAVQERVEMAIAFSREQEFTLYLAMETVLHGWGLSGEERRRAEGIAQMREGLASWRATGAELLRPYYLALQAEAYGKMGLPAEGLTQLAEALTALEKSAERWWEAELYRLKGELSLQSRQVENKPKTSQDKSAVRSPQSEAEECFWKAIEIARGQQAKSLELRAVMSLSRLWHSQGKTGEARRMLAAIYDWFTEGFDTADLKEAKALLIELSGTAGPAVPPYSNA